MNHRDMPAIPTDPAACKDEILWLQDHPLWSHPDPDGPCWGDMSDCIHMMFVYVDPTTETIEDDETRNTAFRVWIEGGGWFDQATDENLPVPAEGWNEYNRWMGSHDIRLDCGAHTAFEALLELARRVRFFYNDDGTDREGVPEQCEGTFLGSIDPENYQTGCEDAGDGFCVRCGFATED